MGTFIRNLLLAVVLVALSALTEPYLDLAVYSAHLARLPPSGRLEIPVDRIPAAALRDSWHAAREAGRQHEGIDIFAPRGTPVRAATEGVVIHVGTSGRGGRVVWILGPAGQRHYYAHLDRFADVFRGRRLAAGDPIGTVGNTGNARITPPHLHYGIYTATGAINPFPLLRRPAPRPGSLEPESDILKGAGGRSGGSTGRKAAPALQPVTSGNHPRKPSPL